ncbi:MAG TPA: TonB-dependent receptor [Gemmatimonadales bacterium]|nr:TonB-dependent receptor [Gemmatimonadales bacterium]
MPAVSVPRLIAACLVLLSPASLLAQQETEPYRLPDIVVSAARIPLRPDAVSATMTVLSGAELRASGVRLVQDALRQVPGAQVLQTGSFGGVTSLFLRGGESDYVKVLVDGVPVNDAGGSFDFATLTLDGVDRIEIIRGPASVTHGSDAVTGVVNIITRSGGDRSATVSARAGTFGTREADASVRGGNSALGWGIAGSLAGTDGTYAFNNDWTSGALAVRLDAHPDVATAAWITGRYGRNTFHFPTDGSGIAADSNQFSRGRALQLGTGVSRQLGSKTQAGISFALSDATYRFNDVSDFPADTTGFAFASERASTAQRWSVDAHATIRPVATTAFTGGVAFERESGDREGTYHSNFGGGTVVDEDPPLDARRTTLAAYAEAVVDLPAGVAGTAGLRLDDNSAFGTFVTWRAGAAWKVLPDTRVRASAGSAFKAPTFAENFANSPFEVGDSTLTPEESIGWEVGAEQVLAGGKASIGVVWFDQRFSRQIQYAFQAPGAPTYFNLGKATARGLEAQAAVHPVPGWTLGASYALLVSEVTDTGSASSPGFAQGEPLIRRPRNSARIWTGVQPVPAVHLGAELRLVGAAYDVDFREFPSERVTLPAHQLLDAHGSVTLIRGDGAQPTVALTGRVENLLNEEYETIVGFPGRLRTVFVGGRLDWRQ